MQRKLGAIRGRLSIGAICVAVGGVGEMEFAEQARPETVGGEMSRGSTPPIWPINVVIVFAFAMSVTAPRGWQRVAQRVALRPAVPHIAAIDPAVLVGRAADVRPRFAADFRDQVPPSHPSKPDFAAWPSFGETTPAATRGHSPAATLSNIPQQNTTQPNTTQSATAPWATTDGATAAPVAPQPVAAQATAPTTAAPAAVVATAPIAAPPIAAEPIDDSLIVVVVDERPTLARPRLSRGVLMTRSQAAAFEGHASVRGAGSSSTPPLIAPPSSNVATTLQPNQTQPVPTPTIIAPALPNIGPKPVAVAEVAMIPTRSPTLVPAVTAPSRSGPSLGGPAIVAPSSSGGMAEQPEPTAVALTPTPTPTPVPAKPAPTVAPTPPEPKSWWPAPADLLQRLEQLGEHPVTGAWSARTTATLERLFRSDSLTSPEAADAIAALRRLTAASLEIDDRGLDAPTAVSLRLARHALVRRLDVWESLAEVVQQQPSRLPALAQEGGRQLEVCLAELETQTQAAGETGLQWRNYLLLDTLQTTTQTACDDEQRRAVAREVLARLRRATSTPERHDFLHEGPFAQLNDSLRMLAEDEIDPQRLLAGLERFELGGLPSDAHELAGECGLLSESPDAAKQKLAVWLNSHYRNANVRVTFSPELLNRLLPEALKKQAPVADTILGKETRGWSTTRTGLRVRFEPNTDRVAIRLGAEGTVSAQTRTFSGPVRLFNLSDSHFTAEKPIDITVDGAEVRPATASTKNNTRLRGIESDYDNMPIIGSLVTAIAENQHIEKKPAAQREVASKVSQHVQRNLDEDIERHLKKSNEKLTERVIVPLQRLSIDPEIIDLQSSENRAAIRLRIAGSEQLAANTPRPRALADNLGSIQIHQSAVNNVIDRLGLQSRHFTLPELYRHLVERLNLPGEADISQLPEELELTFADRDPLTIRCDDGRLEVRLAVNEMRHGERVWRNFLVRASFRPAVIEDTTYFVRDDVVRISGSQLGTTAQISLRTVFAKVFPEDMRVRVWPERLEADPRFADLDIEQIDLREGWIGIAISAARPTATPPAGPHPVGIALPRLLRR